MMKTSVVVYYRISVYCLSILINEASNISYNQVKFHPNATWNTSAITFADRSVLGSRPHNVYVNRKNDVFVCDSSNNRLVIWLTGDTAPTIIQSEKIKFPWSIFVTVNEHIYLGNGDGNDRLVEHSRQTNITDATMQFDERCSGLFIDISDHLYCSMYYFHQVVKRKLDSPLMTPTIIAGNRTEGNTSDTLRHPMGIFVALNFDLYVADRDNHRIQWFQFNNLNGTTVAGSTSSINAITLNGPTGIVLDEDGRLFIVDQENHRIVGPGPSGLQCLVGCSGQGANANQLTRPRALSFDSVGNMFVVDEDNGRIQMFALIANEPDSTTATTSVTLVEQKFSTSTNQKPILTTSQSVSISMKDEREEVPTVIIRSTVDPSTVQTTEEHEESTMTKMQTEKESLTNESGTLSVTVKLMPGSSSALDSPVKVRRSEDIHILSSIKFADFDRPVSITKKWTVIDRTKNTSEGVKLHESIDLEGNELHIPANIFSYGLYQINFRVSFINYASIDIVKEVYIQINPSVIKANLLHFGTSLITSGHEQNLVFNPGRYSLDPDQNKFNRTDWIYTYDYRLHSPLANEDPFQPIDNSSSLLFTNHSIEWQYNDLTFPAEASLLIFGGSLQPGRSYQFQVRMVNRRDSTRQATGHAIVEVEESSGPMVVIGCVIETSCPRNLQQRLINPTSQVALFSRCADHCPATHNITWNVYYGDLSARWTLFDRMDAYIDRWFFGRNRSNFTSLKELFVDHSEKNRWKFEVVYQFERETSRSALSFQINQCPSHGICSIDPGNGTTETVFQIRCSNWSNSENIEDYSLFYWQDDRSKLDIVAFSPTPIFEVRLPAGQLNLLVQIRDYSNCLGEFDLPTMNISINSSTVVDLMKTLGQSPDQRRNNSLIQSLSNGNQNEVAQIISLLAQQLTEIRDQSLEKVLSNEIPFTQVSISSLLSNQRVIAKSNTTVIDYEEALNNQANIREYLIQFLEHPPITSIKSIQLQSLSLVRLTQGTDQLTRTTLMIATEKCLQLTRRLQSTSFEDVQRASTLLLQCASNLLTAVNAPLQQRTYRATRPLAEYETHLSNEVEKKVKEMLSTLTSALNVHLNVGQDYLIKTSEVWMSLERMDPRSLSKKFISNGQVYFPSRWTLHGNSEQPISLRSIILPLASYGHSQSNSELSRMVSITILNSEGNELSFETELNDPIRMVIPRDPNLPIPDMIMCNVTAIVSGHSFSYHRVNVTNPLPVSVHLEIESVEKRSQVSYLFIYDFDRYPMLNSSVQQIADWTLLCPWNLTEEGLYRYSISNTKTEGHRSLIFGVRELNASEMITYCSNHSVKNIPLLDGACLFRSDYQYRSSLSGCYYLNEENQWKSDGLWVGPRTNLYQTECFSSHLTTFVGSLRIVPLSVDWNSDVPTAAVGDDQMIRFIVQSNVSLTLSGDPHQQLCHMDT